MNDEIVELDPKEPVETGIEYSLNLEEPMKRTKFIYSGKRFKVVFVGDSSVGKSCFLHRFCNNHFNSLLKETIETDIMRKTLSVGEHVVSLELWDTAGQERFRSFTKQYLRKAMAVVFMYDVTTKSSFMNMRNWIEYVRACGVHDGCVFCMVGNKVDQPNGSCRVIKYEDGQKLANEFDMLFFETSAFNGDGINKCMEALAINLQLRDVEQMGELIKLEFSESIKPEKKKWKCCPFF